MRGKSSPSCSRPSAIGSHLLLTQHLNVAFMSFLSDAWFKNKYKAACKCWRASHCEAPFRIQYAMFWEEAWHCGMWRPFWVSIIVTKVYMVDLSKPNHTSRLQIYLCPDLWGSRRNQRGDASPTRPAASRPGSTRADVWSRRYSGFPAARPYTQVSFHVLSYQPYRISYICF